jgi:hypothetical protein
VFVPHKFAFKLYEFNVLSVQRRNNFRVPVFAEQTEFFAQVYFSGLIHLYKATQLNG